jgi:hypothetical protein
VEESETTGSSADLDASVEVGAVVSYGICEKVMVVVVEVEGSNVIVVE